MEQTRAQSDNGWRTFFVFVVAIKKTFKLGHCLSYPLPPLTWSFPDTYVDLFKCSLLIEIENS